MDFFLEGVERTAASAVETVRRLVTLFHEDEQKVQTLGRKTTTALQAFHVLRERPVTTINQICARTKLSFPAVSKGIEALVQLGIARELTGQHRNRIFAYDRYLAILNEGTT